MLDDMQRSKLFTVLFLALVGIISPARAAPEPCACPGKEAEEPKEDEPSIFEIAVGSALSFPFSEIIDRTDNTHIAPVSALHVSAELFVTPHWRTFLAYHLPTSSEIREVDGVIFQRVVESTLEAGLVWVPYWADFATHSRIELQAFVDVGIELDGDVRIFPRVGARVNLLQNALEGVGVYFGVAHAFRLNRYTLLYGVAYRF